MQVAQVLLHKLALLLFLPIPDIKGLTLGEPDLDPYLFW